MARSKNDGRGRIGGRTAGTPNKDKPLKTFLREHSAEYFTPLIEEVDEENGKKTGRLISQYDVDLKKMKASDRVNAELQLLKYHTPQMQATNLDLSTSDATQTLTQRLFDLDNGEDVANPAD